MPARLDRLPWSKFHWLVVIGLGTVWILDGLEVTIVGSVAARLTEQGSGIDISAGQIGTAAAFYVGGACTGALFFGQLTDRFGRKKLFVITLGVYLAATVATAFAFAPWYFFAARFFTGAGIGGEYAAINSAIDELIPARVRGRVDLIINGSYWVGSAAGALGAVLLLDTDIFAKDFGWRLAFGIGAVLGLAIMLVRRHVPESPRWLFIHGREEEAERIVERIEQDIREETDQDLPEAEDSITVRQRKSIPFRTIASTAFKVYPRRTVLGLALFIGQAFIYNAITFDLGTLLSGSFDVASGTVPVFIAVYAVSNFLGPLTLGRLFDTVGRKPMISGTYLGSAVVGAAMGLMFIFGTLSTWTFMALLLATFFLASAGASAAYLTVSEIFPMETRALAIAFFYAVGTAVGGITGPVLFGHLIGTGDPDWIGLGFLIGAVVMALGGVAELAFGVKAEQAELEDIAKPLTAEEAEEGGPDGEGDDEPDGGPGRREMREERARGREERAAAADHRAAAREAEAETLARGGDGVSGTADVERGLAEIAELRAQAADERAAAHAARGDAEKGGDDAAASAAGSRAEAAEERARALDERAEAVAAADDGEADRHDALSAAAAERARSHEQTALAIEARHEDEASEGGEAGGDGSDETEESADGEDSPRRAEVAAAAAARADMHERFAVMHTERASAHEHRAAGDEDGAALHERRARELEQRALADEERAEGADLRRGAADEREEEAAAEDAERRRERTEERAEREQRLRGLLARHHDRQTRGLRRYRPGPGRFSGSPGMTVSAPIDAQALDSEMEAIERALSEHGPTERRELSRLVGARYWGPGRFSTALREAVDDGRVRRISRSRFAPVDEETPEG